jgi:hypothetical protein
VSDFCPLPCTRSVLFKRLRDMGLVPESELPIPSSHFLAALLDIENDILEHEGFGRLSRLSHLDDED